MSQHRDNYWKSREEYDREIVNVKRFPVDSDKYFSGFKGRYDHRMMIGRTAGRRNGSFYAIYTQDEIRDVFMNSVTEYEAGTKLFSKWKHWQDFAAANTNKTFVNELRLEKEVQDRYKITKFLWDSAHKGNVSAQKILLEETNKNDTKAVSKKGQALQAELQQKEKEKEVIKSIKENLYLAVVNDEPKKTSKS